jgi:DNA-binding IclR family transcriptional regulator
MATILESNKTKIARRVIEIFEFFDNWDGQATVMDIVRCYGRPQSSTSELLASLVEMGLLYKDQRSRTYRPTPRLATLGSSAQPEIVRDGRLFSFMDRLARSSRYSVALFGQIGTHVQIFRLSEGQRATGAALGVCSGSSERLSASTAGQLLLSTMPNDEAGKILRRLNAEATESEKFNYSAMLDRVALWQRQGHATGEAGFAPDMRLTAVLLPAGARDRALAAGVIYPAAATIDADSLVATLRNGIEQCSAELGPQSAPVPALMRAV